MGKMRIEEITEQHTLFLFFENGNQSYELPLSLTRREQEIPHFYKWWDEL